MSINGGEDIRYFTAQKAARPKGTDQIIYKLHSHVICSLKKIMREIDMFCWPTWMGHPKA